MRKASTPPALATLILMTATSTVTLNMIVPPLAISGLAHVSAGAGAMQSMSVFTKFFPLTSAHMSIPGQADRELDIVIVSRDRVVAMSMSPGPRLATAI